MWSQTYILFNVFMGLVDFHYPMKHIVKGEEMTHVTY